VIAEGLSLKGLNSSEVNSCLDKLKAEALKEYRVAFNRYCDLEDQLMCLKCDPDA
jgi:hypothetical protein